jgi:5'-nucleotidase (lipoprotein e(P4) family)
MKKIILMLIAVACVATALAQGQPAAEIQQKQWSVLWQQHAAEYRALCYQTFNNAKWRLSQKLRSRKSNKKWAIVTDLDETILNNSYVYGKVIKQNKNYTAADWKAWADLGAATAVPGAAEFLNWASSKGVSIFYVSNRDTNIVKPTLANLKRLNLPNADTAHMLFMSNTSSKEPRRKQVAANYKIVMLMGDNLNDFTDGFARKGIKDRLLATDAEHDAWGDQFIVLPNPVYGDWENSLYDFNRRLTVEQRTALRNELLQNTSSLEKQP